MVIKIIAPNDERDMLAHWTAEYRIVGSGNARVVQIDSLSGITVIVSRVLVDWYADFGIPPSYSYYISVPNFNTATEGYADLMQTAHLANDLIKRGMPRVDAQTVAQILGHAANLFEE